MDPRVLHARPPLDPPVELVGSCDCGGTILGALHPLTRGGPIRGGVRGAQYEHHGLPGLHTHLPLFRPPGVVQWPPHLHLG